MARYRYLWLIVAGTLFSLGPVAQTRAATTTNCTARGYGLDPDQAGLNVRKTPSATGTILGKLFSSPDEETNQSTGPWFTISGFSSGWVKIKGADPVTIAIDSPTDKKNFQGSGWVSATLVTLSLSEPTDVAYFVNRIHKAYAKPSFQSNVVEDWATTNARLQYSNLGSNPVILGCSGRWVKLQYRISGYIDRTGEWTPYANGDAEFGSPVTGWIYGETN
jgi:hypothetical protein